MNGLCCLLQKVFWVCFIIYSIYSTIHLVCHWLILGLCFDVVLLGLCYLLKIAILGLAYLLKIAILDLCYLLKIAILGLCYLLKIAILGLCYLLNISINGWCCLLQKVVCVCSIHRRYSNIWYVMEWTCRPIGLCCLDSNTWFVPSTGDSYNWLVLSNSNRLETILILLNTLTTEMVWSSRWFGADLAWDRVDWGRDGLGRVDLFPLAKDSSSTA